MNLSRQQVVILVLFALQSGCAPWQKNRAPEPPQLLRPVEASPESVTLEIFFARVPWKDPKANSSLWERIDEQQFPPELRRHLAANGLRAGMIGGQVPEELADMMRLTETAVGDGQEQKQAAASLESEPAVRRRVLQLRSGRRGEILVSGVIPSLQLLVREEGQVRGRSYKKAQGLFAVQAMPLPDRRVRLTLVPELHHGDAKQQWNGQDGIFQLEMARPKEVYPELELVTDLTTGQMLVVSCLADLPSSLGHHFFSDESARGKEQKILIIRLLQGPTTELYTAQPATPQESL